MFISFSGNDGSGKSTIIKEIQKELGIKAILINEFSGPIITFIKKIILRGSKNVNNIKKGNSRGFIYFIILYIDTILQTFYYKLFHKKKIILKDRYFEDYVITLQELNKYNGILKFLYNFFPKADLSFYIDTNYKIAFERRKNQDKNRLKELNFYKLKYSLYNNFIQNNNYIKIINNSDSIIEHVSKKIINEIEVKYIFYNTKSIVISGIDGAGKTTTINNIKKLLDNSNIKHSEIHFYYNYIIIKFIKIIKNILGINKEKSVEEQYKCSLETEKKAIKSNKSVFWIVFVLLDSFIQYLWIKVIGFNKVKLIDRFFPDYIVSWDFIGVKYNKNIFKYLPKAKNYFLLVAPPEILYKRKPEHSLEFFEKCYNDYLKLSKEYDIHLIDTSKYSENEVVDIIINKLKGTIK